MGGKGSGSGAGVVYWNDAGGGEEVSGSEWIVGGVGKSGGVHGV